MTEKITTKHPMSGQIVADVALVGRFVKGATAEREAFTRLFAHLLVQDEALRQALNRWPGYEDDSEVSGADMVEWFGEWREFAKLALVSPRLLADETASLRLIELEAALLWLKGKRDQLSIYIRGIDPQTSEARNHARTIAEGRVMQIDQLLSRIGETS